MLADCELSLPISPTMTLEEAAEVVRLVNAFKEWTIERVKELRSERIRVVKSLNINSLNILKYEILSHHTIIQQSTVYL